jgi:hypothetical protein
VTGPDRPIRVYPEITEALVSNSRRRPAKRDAAELARIICMICNEIVKVILAVRGSR